MSLKLKSANFFVKLGLFFQEIPLFILRPKELIRFGQSSYGQPASISFWTDVDFVDSGLLSGEKELFAELESKKGNLLLLGLGGGREAIFFAKSGFRVTGIDFVKEMVDKSMAHARESNVEIQGVVQDISQLDFPHGSFDVIWFSCSIYSSVPGRKKRIEMLARAKQLLVPEGRVACLFYWNPSIRHGNKRWVAGKLLSWLTLGNFSCEKGDILKNNQEFLHAFSNQDDLHAEFAEAGFEVLRFVFPDASHNAGALLRKIH